MFILSFNNYPLCASRENNNAPPECCVAPLTHDEPARLHITRIINKTSAANAGEHVPELLVCPGRLASSTSGYILPRARAPISYFET